MDECRERWNGQADFLILYNLYSYVLIGKSLFGGNGGWVDRSVPPCKVTVLKGKGTVTLYGGMEWSTRLPFPPNRLLVYIIGRANEVSDYTCPLV